MALACGVALGTAGCGDGGRRLGPSPARARANADALLGSLEGRFGPVEAAPGYDALRVKLGKSALVPSRLFGDSAVWTSSGDDRRRLEIGGRPEGEGYLLGGPAPAAAPRRPGEYRRTVELRDLGEGAYEWSVRDELAVGSVSGAELGAVLEALLEGAERRDPAAVRAAYHAALPRTTRALGRLFTLDSIAAAPAPGGGTRLTLATTTHPDRIAAEFPHLARFLERYASPARVEIAVADSLGTTWWTARLDRDRMRLDLRVDDGRLAPLDGPTRVIPDRLAVRVAASTRFGLFRVGLSGLVGDLTLVREPGRKAFTARFHDEPEWHFPPLVERFLRAPLRRPFEGEGASLGYAARTSGGSTALVRDYRLAVQESAIVRWLGSLGSSTVSDFRAGAERESDRFNGEFLGALRADAAALLR